MTVPVYIEVGAKRTFASAVDWPGWSRGGRTEDDALQSLLDHGPRYAAVAKKAVQRFAPPARVSSFQIVERLRGNTGTDFGVPTLGPASDARPIADAERARLVALLEASWATLDLAARKAKSVRLRKGPRGGGRDLDKIVGHVIEADEAYIVQLGAKRPKTIPDDPKRVARLRRAIVEALEMRARGLPLAEPSRARTIWTPRYFVRRASWHVLDHAWEIEDRASRSAT